MPSGGTYIASEILIQSMFLRLFSAWKDDFHLFYFYKIHISKLPGDMKRASFFTDECKVAASWQYDIFVNIR